MSSGGHGGLARLVLNRLLLGVATLVFVSVVVFFATAVLPGDAARAILGREATPERLEALRHSLRLDQPVLSQYLGWATAMLRGDPGLSLASQLPVTETIAPKLRNTGVLVILVSVIGIPLSVFLGVLATLKSGGLFDRVASVVSLALAALPEFIVGIILILTFSTVVLHWFPPVSLVPPGHTLSEMPIILVLPVATLILVIFPYIFRMIRSSMRDVLQSEYIEMAQLKGVRRSRLIWLHALPNAIGPTFQVIALTVAYLAGGVVVVEYLFGFPGIGQLLLDAIRGRDLPVIQCIVLMLAGFYVLVNILADLATVLVTPRLRARESRS
ncbi:ABC transporter permease [Mesorhizobium sp. 2RAF21]|uniref:ABC transporter permease n=1 Tax=Mesorhizobium sp. 2RAF21 TaxID=3232995 RepID=UPI003F9A8B9A